MIPINLNVKESNKHKSTPTGMQINRLKQINSKQENKYEINMKIIWKCIYKIKWHP